MNNFLKILLAILMLPIILILIIVGIPILIVLFFVNKQLLKRKLSHMKYGHTSATKQPEKEKDLHDDAAVDIDYTVINDDK